MRRWAERGEVLARKLPGRGEWRIAIDDEGFPLRNAGDDDQEQKTA